MMTSAQKKKKKNETVNAALQKMRNDHANE